MKQTITISGVDPQAVKTIKEEAEKRNRTFSGQVRMIFEEWIKTINISKKD